MSNQLLPLADARKQQEALQRKAVCGFCLSLLAVSAVTVFLVYCTDYFSRFPSLYALPLLVAAFCFYKTRMHLFFAKKEVTGKVQNIEAYEVATRMRQSGERQRSIIGVEMRIVVELESGKNVVKTFPGGKAFEELKPGDRIALLRFLDFPIDPNT